MTKQSKNLFTGDTRYVINARQLHSHLKVGRDYATWYNAKINKYGFQQNDNYITHWINNNGDTYSPINESHQKLSALGYHMEHFITMDMAKQLCRLERNNPNASIVLKDLYSISDDIEPIIKEQPRAEYQFGEMLEKITGLKWDKQYPIDGGKYRLDFKLGTTLIVEYDEEQHKYNSLYNKKDEIRRTKYCINWLAKHETNGYKIPVIRVRQRFELDGLHEIIKNLILAKKFDLMIA